MTLSTHVGIVEAVDPHELHAWVNKHLLNASDAVFDVYGSNEKDGWQRDKIMNRPGQGLDAWVITRHNNGAPIVWYEPEDTTGEVPAYYQKEYGERGREMWTEAVEEEIERYAEYPSVHAYVDFDTAYGYTGSGGEDCNTLHAQYIVRLINEFAKPRGLTVVWKNEYTGEWFTDLDGLEDFFNAGDKAQDWFRNVVMPSLPGLINEGL